MKALSHMAVLALLGLAACDGKGASNDSAAADQGSATSAAQNAATSRTMGGMAMPAGSIMAKGTGTVTAIDKAAGTITLDHGPIPEAKWPAMTMTFKAGPGVLDKAVPGEKVTFDVTLANGSGEVTSVQER